MEDHCYYIKLISESVGNGLFAKRFIKKGEVILQEKPLICSQFEWNRDPVYPYFACDHCLTPLDTAEVNVSKLTKKPDIKLPFSECCEVKSENITKCDNCNVSYCSSNCKKEAFERYHKTLCVYISSPQLLMLIHTWKRLHYPPETTSIMLIIKIVALLKQHPDLKQIFSEFCKKTVVEEKLFMHFLLDQKFENHINTLRQQILTSIDTNHISEWFTHEGFRSLLALIGTNGQGIGTSSFAQWIKNVENLQLDDNQKVEIDAYIDTLYMDLNKVVGLQFLNNEGSGLYHIQSKINHSCKPNSIVEFPYSNSTLIIKALADIPENEQIYISYVDECNLYRCRNYRQNLLRKMYLFQCTCDKCLYEADDSTESENENDSTESENENDSTESENEVDMNSEQY